MKNLILISAILLVVGCGKGKEAQTKTKVTEKCEYCGKSFPIEDVRFHVKKCPKNTGDYKKK